MNGFRLQNEVREKRFDFAYRKMDHLRIRFNLQGAKKIQAKLGAAVVAKDAWVITPQDITGVKFLPVSFST